MLNEVLIACGMVSLAAVALSIALQVFLEKDSSSYRRSWSLCEAVLLVLVVTYTWTALADFLKGSLGHDNYVAGPRGYIIEDLLVFFSGIIAAPAAFIALALLSLVPPLKFAELMQRRVKVYGLTIAVIAAIVSLCLALIH